MRKNTNTLLVKYQGIMYRRSQNSNKRVKRQISCRLPGASCQEGTQVTGCRLQVAVAGPPCFLVSLLSFQMLL